MLSGQEDAGSLGTAAGLESAAASEGCQIWVAGEEASFDEVRERVAGKWGFGHATRSSLPYYANQLGVLDPGVGLYTSPDLGSIHLPCNAEEKWFLGRVFGRVCVPGAELMLAG